MLLFIRYDIEFGYQITTSSALRAIFGLFCAKVNPPFGSQTEARTGYSPLLSRPRFAQNISESHP